MTYLKKEISSLQVGFPCTIWVDGKPNYFPSTLTKYVVAVYNRSLHTRLENVLKINTHHRLLFDKAQQWITMGSMKRSNRTEDILTDMLFKKIAKNRIFRIDLIIQ